MNAYLNHFYSIPFQFLMSLLEIHDSFFFLIVAYITYTHVYRNTTN